MITLRPGRDTRRPRRPAGRQEPPAAGSAAAAAAGPGQEPGRVPPAWGWKMAFAGRAAHVTGARWS